MWDLPGPGIEPTYPVSPILAGGFFTTEPPGKPLETVFNLVYIATYSVLPALV